MTGQKTIANILMKARPRVRRAVYILFILSFLLPYVDVLGCSSKKITTYHGYELIKGYPAIFYLLSIAIFIVLFAISFSRKERTRSFRAFAAVWRAMAAAIACFIVALLPGLQFLFDGVFMLAGQFMGLACAGAVFIDGAAESLAAYPSLRREWAAMDESRAYSSPLAMFHAGAAVFSLILVPVYFIGLRNDIIIAFFYFIMLSLPFVFSQGIVIEGAARREPWTRRWAWAVSLLLAAATGVSIMSVL